MRSATHVVASILACAPPPLRVNTFRHSRSALAITVQCNKSYRQTCCAHACPCVRAMGCGSTGGSTGMADNPVPPEVRLFIFDCIESVAHLEALLLLKDSPEQDWDVSSLARRLYVG